MLDGFAARFGGLPADSRAKWSGISAESDLRSRRKVLGDSGRKLITIAVRTGTVQEV